MKKLFKRVSILFAALMALSVSTVRTVEEVKAAEIVDTLNNAFTGVTGTSYTDWSDKKASSDAIYKGQSAGGNTSIQLRSKNSNSGIVTTASGGNVSKIEVSWNSKTNTSRVLDIYGKNTAYTAATDLYSSTTQGTKLGSIKYGASTLEISGDYAFIGLRSNSDAMYLNEIKITWDVNDGTEPEKTPAEKVESGLNYAKGLISSFYGESVDVELPATNDDGVNFTYTLSDHNESSFAIDEDGIFTTNPKAALESAKLTITAELEGETKTEEVTIHSASTTKVLPLSEAVKVGEYFGSSYSSDKFYIEVTIKSIYNTQYGNAYVNDGTVSDDFIIYGLYSSNGSTRYDAMEVKPLAGDKIKVYGILGTYSNAAQMKSGWIVEHTISHTNEELIAMEETSFSLSFDYALTYKEEEVEGTGVETTASLSFADKAQRTSYSTSQQVWEQNGIKLTGKKAESSTAVGDYANPARFYASSSVSVEVAEGCTISEIVFTTTEGAAALVSSIGDEASASGNIVTCKPTNSSNVYEIAKLSAKVFVSSISVKYASVGGTVEVVDDQAYANVGLTFGAKVTSTLFEGYTKVSGGVMIDNAANYTNTTIAEAYANGEFAGITTVKESLNVTDDGFYSVGSTIEVIDGLVDENNKKYLSYEFVAAVYFTLENAEGTTTVVLEQKAYSVSTMVDYYLANSSGLGLNDETVKVVEAFDTFIG